MDGQFSPMQEQYIRWRNESYQLIRTPSTSLTHREDIQTDRKRQYENQALNYLKCESQIEVGMVIMAGGMSARYEKDDPKEVDITILRKQLLQSIDKVVKKKWRVIVYLVCSDRNIRYLYDDLKDKDAYLEKCRIYLCQQHEAEVLDEYGLSTIYNQHQEKLQYSSGVGNVLNSCIEYGSDLKTIQQHLESQNINYVYCYGVGNMGERGLDPLMLGYLMAHDNVDMVFRCCPPNLTEDKLPRVCKRQVGANQCWQVLEHQVPWLEKLPPEQFTEYQHSMVWMHHFVFRMDKLRMHPPTKSFSRSSYQFVHRKLKGENENEQLCCIIGEKKISSLVMGEKFVCEGIVDKRSQYFPIITVEDYQAIDQQLGSMLTFKKNSISINKMNSTTSIRRI